MKRDDGTVAGKRIMLIDDVLTTGSTASECARILKKGGAEAVVVVYGGTCALRVRL